MLLSCDRKRMSGPRFFPAGRRLGPYFCRRLAASPASRPFMVLVLSRFTTSSAARACQAVVLLAGLAFSAAFMNDALYGTDPDPGEHFGMNLGRWRSVESAAH